ncbi:MULTISPECIES: lantibiotic dehydratase family protein [unclassified Streptomyces]|uniref:lantibiotic dehydratase family protein n=1 Tax=unclassified Streptomyces TaxID=2593676 RepID=UPI001F035684|nr:MULTISPECIES: lantibiotic dehydratase family protein [unclassified Streptomyces]MCH0561747.1 lantibiotic dehydratase [Streptomyces sp. MUM 2J]MCH0569032.1 lantibiotic dehydratase [Streptomyces sp. MUM 136J]
MSVDTSVEPTSPPQPAEPARAGRPVLADTLLMRVNPLPGRRLGAPGLTVALRALAAAGTDAAKVADQACDELYDVAGRATGRDRHRALQLRRDIHNQRDPAPALMSGDWPPAVAAWLDARQRSLLARAALTAGHGELVAHERAVLAELCAAEPFQLSLALNSPQVLDAVRRYRSGFAAPSARLRKSERGILQHLTRAMVRTSPLSRFTAVGFAHWSPQGQRLDAGDFDRRSARAFVSLDRALFGAVVTGTGERPWDTERAAAGLPAVVESNRSLRADDSQVRFVRRLASGVKLVSASLTRPLSVLLALTALGPIRTDVLAAELTARLGLPPARTAGFLAQALAAGILRPGPALDEQLADPLPAARAVLRRQDPDALPVLDETERALRDLTSGGVSGRVAALTRLRRAEADLNARSLRPARLHVNEDLVLPPAQVTDEGYGPALADLADVTSFLSVFDRHHEVRALLGTAFADRYGPGARVDLLDAADDLVTMVYRRETALSAATAEDFGPPDGALADLLALRSEAVGHVLLAVDAAGDAPEAALDPAALAAFADRMPAFFRRRAASYALLVQPADGRLVLNDCYGGRNLLGSRFLGPDRDLGGDTADRTAARVLRQFGSAGGTVLEDRGLHNANINHRIPLLPDTLTPEDWAGLRLDHDPATDTLSLTDRDGRTVVPVTCGMKWSELLPAPLRIAMWLADSGRVTLDPLAGVRARRLRAGEPAGRTMALPRLTAGQVVLGRRRWYPGDDFPAEAGALGEAEHLIALTDWRAAHDVPEEVVAKTPLGGLPSREGDDGVRAYVQARRRDKPQYLDLGSALTARVLPRLLDRRSPGYLEEALPGVRPGRHAVEWAVEYDLPAGDAAGPPPEPSGGTPTRPEATARTEGDAR